MNGVRRGTLSFFRFREEILVLNIITQMVQFPQEVYCYNHRAIITYVISYLSFGNNKNKLRNDKNPKRRTTEIL